MPPRLLQIRHFASRALFEQLWLVPVWFLLGISRATVLLVPFRRIAQLLGVHVGVASWVPLLNARQEKRAIAIGRTILLAARFTPWNSNCFAQAITARILLRLYGIPYALYFGLAHDEHTTEMKAHAWVSAGRVSVSGGPSFSQYTVVGCFISAPFTRHIR